MDDLTDTRHISRLEIVDTGRRRRWSAAEKLRIVEESFSAPRLASATARRHGISNQLLFAWRTCNQLATITALTTTIIVTTAAVVIFSPQHRESIGIAPHLLLSPSDAPHYLTTANQYVWRREPDRLNSETAMNRSKTVENDHIGQPERRAPPIVPPETWEAARQEMLVKEKALMRARDALAAERRRMPWMVVGKAYEFEGPKGKVSLLDLFEGRRQLIVYRAFFEPGVFGWPEHACRGCSLGADQVAHLAHLNARNTTLAYASRAPQADIARLKARMGWQMPWYTITDSFDADFGVDEWHGHNVFFRDGDKLFRTYFINSRGDEAMGTTWSYLDITPLGRQETWEDLPEGYPQTPPYKWWNWHDNYDSDASPDPKWVEVSDAGEAAFRKRDAEAKA